MTGPDCWRTMFQCAGTENPLPDMIALARQHGAKDAGGWQQAVMPYFVDTSGRWTAIFTFSPAAKLYGPTGIGILYVKEGVAARIPPMGRAGR